MNDRQTQLTKEQIQENWSKKRRSAAMANMNRNNARRIQASQQQNPELFNFIEALGNKGGLPLLKQLHVMLSDYIVMSEYNGGKEN